MLRIRFVAVFSLALLALAPDVAIAPAAGMAETASAVRPEAPPLPLRFEQNAGQAAAPARFIPGVDVVFYGAGGRLEYDLVIESAPDARRIALEVEGASAVRPGANGSLFGKGAVPVRVRERQIEATIRPEGAGFTWTMDGYEAGGPKLGFALEQEK